MDTIRCFLVGHDGRTYMKSNPNTRQEYQEFMGLLSTHPVWSTRLDDIIGIKVTHHRLNDAIILQLKTNKIWFTVSWRDCRERKRVGTLRQPIEHKRLAAAMRHSIKRQVMSWSRDHYKEATCTTCNGTIKLQVDHKTRSFDQIMQDFIARNQAPAPVEFDLISKTCESVFRHQDRVFKSQWQQYHRETADYQWLCQSCNIKKGNKCTR